MEICILEYKKTKEEWPIFYNKWKRIVYAKTQNEYNFTQRLLSNTQKNTFFKKVDYLFNIWLLSLRQKFVKYYTNKISYYKNIVIF